MFELEEQLVAIPDLLSVSEKNGEKNKSFAIMIGDQIRSRLLPRSGSLRSKFLPLGDLQYILSHANIEKLLQEIPGCSSSESADLNSKIRSEKSSLKIFAILILIQKVDFINLFMQHGVHDEHLPLLLNAAIFESWDPFDTENFCERQYVVTAPIFDFTKVHHLQWDKSHRMPFLEPLKWKARGAHGEIAKVKIHSDHQRWDTDLMPDLETSCFAVKRFTTKDATDFEQEKEALLQFSGANNKHKSLIKLLLSYQIEDKFYMIFPWAQGNLAEFWEKYSSKPQLKQDWNWLIQQCLGMSDGLSTVHGHNLSPKKPRHSRDSIRTNNRDRGRHGDIKPENILFFEDPESNKWHLVIADFTLMRFHSLKTVKNTRANQVHFSRTYCPPEVEQGSDVNVDQTYDVWTLGCVYLEFITWYLLGYDAVRRDTFKTSSGKVLESFVSMRRNDYSHLEDSNDKFFNHPQKSAPKVKKSVGKWIKILRKNEYCSAAMHDFLTLIAKHMLVLLPKNRYPMDKVRNELQIIVSKCQQNDTYCYAGNPKESFGRWISHLLRE